MTNLLIVESPAKCSKIQGFLGPGWKVLATMGHIRALEENLDAVGIHRDFEPRFSFLKEKSKAIHQLKEAAAAATTIYLASDDDREGEAISYSVAILLKLNPATTPRAVFHEITESAVKQAVSHPRRLDMNRVWAQQARAVLDMMVGFTISPLLWKYVGQALSAGRCQTPALRLLCDREQSISEFKAETTWGISGQWSGAAAAAATNPFEAQMVEELEDQESATNYLEILHTDSTATIKEAVTRPTTESPPLPLITSTLQQEVSATMGIQPKNTMRIAQRLYEAGHITYMRTDSAVLSEEARVAAEEFVRARFGDVYVGSATAAVPAQAKTSSKKKSAAAAAAPPAAQEAHEAIRPTHVDMTELPADEDWNASDRKVYKLIWNRAVQSVMAPARGEARTITFVANPDSEDFEWKSQWRRQTFAGWRMIGAAATNLDAEGEEGTTAATAAAASAAAWAAATTLSPGQTLHWTTLQAAPATSKPPGRYTEATLVRELETKGIGRPSTFAQLVGTILDKGYAEKRDTPPKEVKVPRLRLESVGQWPPTITMHPTKVGAERQKLAPTPLGRSVLDFCLREFPALFAYEFTAQMESRLDTIATGAEAWKTVCHDTWDSYKARYEALKTSQGSVAAATMERWFSNGIKAIQSKKGPLLLKEGPGKGDAVFYGWPSGPSAPSFGAITDEEVANFVAERSASMTGSAFGEYNGSPIVKKSGPYGPYVECNGVKVPLTAEDTEETVIAKLEAKSSTAASLHVIGPFEFRTGPYGVYMFKKDLVGKARKFVGIPSGVDPKALTQEAAIKLYQTGLQNKAKAAAFGGGGGRGGGHGGRGGRGGKKT